MLMKLKYLRESHFSANKSNGRQQQQQHKNAQNSKKTIKQLFAVYLRESLEFRVCSPESRISHHPEFA